MTGDLPTREGSWGRIALVASVGAIAIALVIVAVVVAVSDGGHARVRVERRRGPAATSSRRVTTTSPRPTNAMTVPTSTRRSPGAPVRTRVRTVVLPAATVAPPEATTPTTPTAAVPATAPWPAGTSLKSDHLTSTVTFDPPRAMFGQTIGVTATIDNPDDNWVFASLSEDPPGVPCGPAPDDCSYTAADLGISLGDDPNALSLVARGNGPAFLHHTAAGVFDGLLLPPHGSYQLSARMQINGAIGTAQGPPNGPWTLDAYVAIRYPGHAGAAGEVFVRRTRGTLTLLANSIVTTPTSASPG